MSASVDYRDNTISLTRGDSLYLDVSFTVDGAPYVPGEGDTVRFAMKKCIEDDECLILIDIPIETMVCHIEPEDTKNLDFDVYWYDISLTTAIGDVYTPIGPAKSRITKEVY